jgi:hypothetical protein
LGSCRRNKRDKTVWRPGGCTVLKHQPGRRCKRREGNAVCRLPAPPHCSIHHALSAGCSYPVALLPPQGRVPRGCRHPLLHGTGRERNRTC